MGDIYRLSLRMIMHSCYHVYRLVNDPQWVTLVAILSSINASTSWFHRVMIAVILIIKSLRQHMRRCYVVRENIVIHSGADIGHKV